MEGPADLRVDAVPDPARGEREPRDDEHGGGDAKDASGPVTARRSRQSQASASGTSSTAYSFAAAATPSSAERELRPRSATSAATAATVRNAGHAS